MNSVTTGDEKRIDDSTSVPILIFRMGSVRSAFLLDAVVQVFDAVDVGDFPEAPPQNVLGVINVRGLRIPLVDIRTRWGMRGGKVQLSQQLIVIECEGTTISVIVDEVIGTRNVPLKKIVNFDDILPESNPHMAVADLEGILILIDSDRLFDASQLQEITNWVDNVIG